MSNVASKARRSKNTIRLSHVNFREGMAGELVNSQRHFYQRMPLIRISAESEATPRIFKEAS
jgi:hypothetical protein